MSPPTESDQAPVSVYHHDHDITLLTGHALAGLAALPAGLVDTLVTSPPYWRLRDYGISPAQIGLEPTAQSHIAALREVLSTARRVLTRRATVWLNLGDSYSTNTDGYRCAQPGQGRQPCYRPVADLPHKNLLGMPWRVAFALQEDGWILRSAVIWHKPHAAPTPVRDRLACRYEMLFLLVAHDDYYFDLDAIRSPTSVIVLSHVVPTTADANRTPPRDGGFVTPAARRVAVTPAMCGRSPRIAAAAAIPPRHRWSCRVAASQREAHRKVTSWTRSAAQRPLAWPRNLSAAGSPASMSTQSFTASPSPALACTTTAAHPHPDPRLPGPPIWGLRFPEAGATLAGPPTAGRLVGPMTSRGFE